MIEKERVFDFLHGLNPNLDEVKGRLWGSKPFPSIKEAFAEIKREESRKKVMLSATSDGPIQGGSALVVTKSKRGANRGDPSKEKQWCDHCQRPYHT